MTQQIILGGTYTTRNPYGSAVGRAVRGLLSFGRRPAARGVHILAFDPTTGAVELKQTLGGIKNPSWLALHPSGHTVYAVSEVAQGEVSAISIAAESGELELMNRLSSAGAAPCHATTDKNGRWVYTANYASGTIAQHTITERGRLGERVDLIRHVGSSSHPRQRSPHPHCIAIAPDNRFAFVPDLGTDRVIAYRIDQSSGRLTAYDSALIRVPSGHGPRVLAFNPNQRQAFLLCELSSTVTSYAYDAERGHLTPIQSVRTVPDDWTHKSTAAGIDVHPAGDFLYVSNRGYDSVAVFRIGGDGRLARTAITPTGGRTPRGIAIDPSGRYLLAAHQTSDDIVTFQIDPAAGTLTAVSRSTVPTCVCLQFVDALQ